MSDQFPVVEGETFAHIPQHPGYAACSDGSIYSKQSGTWKRLSPALDKYGYATVGPCVDGRQHTRTVHRLVASAFHGPCPPGMQCRHLDGNKANNRPGNLAWGTLSDNARDKLLHGTTYRPTGSKHHHAKLNESDVADIKAMIASGRMLKEIAAKFSLTRSTVGYIKAGKTWRHVPG